MTDCVRFGKWFRGCHFEARYDETSMTTAEYLGDVASRVTKIHGGTPEKRIYVCDICTTCGKKVMR